MLRSIHSEEIVRREMIRTKRGSRDYRNRFEVIVQFKDPWYAQSFRVPGAVILLATVLMVAGWLV